MSDATEYQENLREAERFFHYNKHGFLFAVSNDELVQRNLNSSLQQLLRGKGKTLLTYTWDTNPEALHPVKQLRQFQQNHLELNGLILNGLEPALEHNPNFLVQLNFGREGLAELRIPLLFWVSNRTLQRVNREALDLYNQRVSANLYFEHDPTLQQSDNSALRYIAQETVRANKSLAGVEERMKLLQQQLDEAEKQHVEPKTIANEIVLELLELYSQILGAEPLIHTLLNKYEAFIDRENPENCFKLARVLYEIGMRTEAMDLYQKALQTLRELAVRNPDIYLPHVATTLNNLGALQYTTNDYTAALASFTEALTIRRELAAKNPDVYLPDVADTLNNLGALQSDMNDYAAALASFTEALTLYRELAVKNPDVYLLYVAGTLNNLGILQYNTNDYAAALASYNEALTLYRELATKNPDVYLPDVAMTLSNLGNLQYTTNDYAAALASYTEALTIRRELAVKNPDVYLPDVATTLNNLGALQSETNDYAAALTSFTEALTLYREFATKNPDVYLPYVAGSLINMAVWYYKAPQANQQQSLAFVTEALHIALSLVEKIPNVQLNIDSAYNLLRAWGIEPEEFVKQVGTSGASGGE